MSQIVQKNRSIDLGKWDQYIIDLLHGSGLHPQTISKQKIQASQSSPIDSKMHALDSIQQQIQQEKDKIREIARNKEKLQDLFTGFRNCLNSEALQSLSGVSIDKSQNSVSDQVVELILKANMVLFEIMPEITHAEGLERHIADLIPIFIENLGSPKAVVRKSTHKCIGTYVKLTRKLEYVLIHLISTGLDNPNSRTRQHSMLVIPALLSLKASIMEKESPSIQELILAVLKRIQSDSSEIVSKTGKKLLLELQKCYPDTFKQKQIETLKNADQKMLCNAVLSGDDYLLKQLMELAKELPALAKKKSEQKEVVKEEVKVISPKKQIMPTISQKAEEKSKQDEEISKQEVVEYAESVHPRATNGLLFGLLADEVVNSLEENNVRKALTMERIENEVNSALGNNELKQNFMPFAAEFLGLMTYYIKDANFKVCLTAIQITRKLLVLNIVQINKQRVALISTLIEKLSDSKVVIRQAVLKCCGFIISNSQTGMQSIMIQSIKMVQNNNWHVREGILHLIANCLIERGQQDELNGSKTDDPSHFSYNTEFIAELCQLSRTETKQKIMQMAIDCLALSLDIAPNRQTTEQILTRELSDFQNPNSKDFIIFNQIKERQNKDYLPALQLDGTIEFKPAGVISDTLPNSPSKLHHQNPVLRISSRMVHEEEQAVPIMRLQHQRILEAKQEQIKEQQSPYQVIQSKREQFSGTEIKTPSNPTPIVPIAPKIQVYQTPEVHTAKENKVVQDTKRSDIASPLQIPKSSVRINNNQMGSGLQPSPDPQKQFNPMSDETKIKMWLPNYVDGKFQTSTIPKKTESQVKEAEETLNSTSPYQVQSAIQKQQQIEKKEIPSKVQELQNNINLIPMNKIQRVPTTKVKDTPGSQTEEGRSQKTTASQLTSMNKGSTLKTLNYNRASPVSQAPPQDLNQTEQPPAQVYVPEQRQKIARIVHSNEARQRGIESEIIKKADPPKEFISIQQSPLRVDQKQMTGQAFTTNQSISQAELKQQQQNMSQSSGAPGGFNIDRTTINQRLQLLKSTFKYKNASEIDQYEQEEEIKGFDNSESIDYRGMQPQKAASEHNARTFGQKPTTANAGLDQNFMAPLNAQKTHQSFGFSNLSSNPPPITDGLSSDKRDSTAYNFAKRQIAQKQQKAAQVGAFETFQKNINPSGPVRATVLPKSSQVLNTIQLDNSQINIQQNSNTVVKKPPLKIVNNTEVKRQGSSPIDSSPIPMMPFDAQSNVDSLSAFPSAFSGAETTYNAPDEPLRNPDLQFKQCLDNLKSDNWQKIFDALNIIKRIATFHKDLLSQSNPAARECIKLIVVQTENLRSQVAKNACMALLYIFQELPTKDLDPHIENVLSALIKAACSTNHFVSEQADKALSMLCHGCTDNKVFNGLLMIPIKSNNFKVKVAACYCNLVSKLDEKIKTFKDCERLVKAIVTMLGEGALEVRQQAKLAILTLKNNFQNQRELDKILLRSALSEKQMEQVRKILDSDETTSNFAGTRYGASSLDSRGGGARQGQNMNASGSDGFNASVQDQKMQTFLSASSANVQATGNNFGMTGNSNVFKKRNASVTKPVDPQLMEEFKSVIAGCQISDWNMRLQSIDTLTKWISAHSLTVKQSQQSKFIQLVDTFTKLIQDNNAKVQAKGLQAFQSFLVNENLRVLIDQNLTMIVQALAHNFGSSNSTTRSQSEQLFELLINCTETPSQLIQPMTAQLNLANFKSKAAFVQQLVTLLKRVKSDSLVEKYVVPLVSEQNKLQSEAKTNASLKEALKLLEVALQN